MHLRGAPVQSRAFRTRALVRKALPATEFNNRPVIAGAANMGVGRGAIGMACLVI